MGLGDKTFELQGFGIMASLDTRVGEGWALGRVGFHFVRKEVVHGELYLSY